MDPAPTITTPTTEPPAQPVTFLRDGLPYAGLIFALFVPGIAITWFLHLALNWQEFIALLVGAFVVFTLVMSTRNGAAAKQRTTRIRTDRNVFVAAISIGTGLGGIAITSVLMYKFAWTQVLAFILMPTLIAVGNVLLSTGLPRRVGTQRVCKFCNYEYTFGYPPETDITAPPRCPECGKGWLADLALGVKRFSAVRITAGAVCIALGMSLFAAPLWNRPFFRWLPTPMLITLTTAGGSSRQNAWSELSSRLAAFTPQQHEELFTALLDLRRESRYRISREQHAYLQQQAPQMPPELRERFFRETFIVTARRGQATRPDRTNIVIRIDEGDYIAQALLRITRVTAAQTDLPLTLEQAWPGMQDITHFFNVTGTRDELFISVPRTDGPLSVHVTAAVLFAPAQLVQPTTVPPPSSQWTSDLVIDVPAN